MYRLEKVAAEIRKEASQIVNFDLSDPHLQGAVVTNVRMSPDLKLARIYFALPGCEEKKRQVLEAFKKAAPYVRRLLSQRLKLKYSPEVQFFYDEGLELENKLKELLG